MTTLPFVLAALWLAALMLWALAGQRLALAASEAGRLRLLIEHWHPGDMDSMEDLSGSLNRLLDEARTARHARTWLSGCMWTLALVGVLLFACGVAS